jgi:nucleotide-binding universal stress UspA family protein
MLPVRTVLHPTDFSERSDHAFHLACALARDCGARLFVLHVMKSPLVLYGGAAPPRWRQDDEDGGCS